MTKITSLVFAAVLSIGFPVSAITIDTTTSASGSAQSGNGIDVGVTSESQVGSNTGAKSDSGADVSIDAGGTTVIADSEDLADVDVTIMSSGAVSSQNDLNAYAEGVVKTNADVRDVVLSNEEVAVSYRSYARIFGIIPTKVFARAYVTSDGDVMVKYPWYAFASQKKAALESKVKASVKAMIPSASASAEARASLSAQAQAAILEKTVATMKADFDAETAAKAQVN